MIRCDHADAVQVRSIVSNEVLAALCPGCGEQLPAEWLTCDHSTAHESSVDITTLGEPPGRRFCNGCGVSYWPPPLAIKGHAGRSDATCEDSTPGMIAPA